MAHRLIELVGLTMHIIHHVRMLRIQCMYACTGMCFTGMSNRHDHQSGTTKSNAHRVTSSRQLWSPCHLYGCVNVNVCMHVCVCLLVCVRVTVREQAQQLFVCHCGLGFLRVYVLKATGSTMAVLESVYHWYVCFGTYILPQHNPTPKVQQLCTTCTIIDNRHLL